MYIILKGTPIHRYNILGYRIDTAACLQDWYIGPKIVYYNLAQQNGFYNTTDYIWMPGYGYDGVEFYAVHKSDIKNK